jgi:TolB protein
MQRIAVVIAALLLGAGCQGSATGTTTTTTAAVDTATEAAVESLVVATTAGDVVVHDVSGSAIERLASSPEGGHRQPVWWGDDAIIATRTSGDGHALVAFSATDGSTIWEAPMASPPFYYLPSPEGSEWATTSLRNDPGGGGLIAELVDASGTVEQLSTASPFYASWSPDGTRLALHTGGARLGIWDPDRIETIASPTGLFQAPAWTGSGIVTLRTVADGQALSLWSEGGFEDLALIEGPVRFVATTSRVAIQAAGRGDPGGVGVRAQARPELPAGRLLVVDVRDGSVSTIEDVLTPMFQWDPSGRKLLYATFDDGESLRFTWHVWDDGEIVDHASFEAQPAWFRDVVPFFDQYAQSMRMWSPSGERFAFPEVVDGRNVVTVQPVDGSPPFTIDGAIWAAFPPG